MSCPCPSPSPSPSCSPLPETISGNIAMYFGTIRLSGICTNCSQFNILASGILDNPTNSTYCVDQGGTWTAGNYTKIFATTGEDFTLEFSARDLVEAGILPSWIDSTKVFDCDAQSLVDGISTGDKIPYNDLPTEYLSSSTNGNINFLPGVLYPFDKFILSEQELLSTGSFEAWLTWCSLRWGCFDQRSLDCSRWKNLPFGLKVMYALGMPVENTVAAVTRLIKEAKQGKPAGIGTLSNVMGTVAELWNNFSDIISPISSNQVNTKAYYAQQYEKLKICYEWLKSIHDTYYGKQFLVKIGNKTPAGSHVPFKGICVKNAHGDYPEPSSYPLVVYGDGSSQDLFLSDQIAVDGGYPLRSTTNILGLSLGSELDDVRTEDGRVTSFIKFGYMRYWTSPNNKWKQVVINKFGYDFIIDLGSMSASNYFIAEQTIDSNRYEVLYVKATVSDEIYFLNDPEGQWAKITLNEMVPLTLLDDSGIIQHGAELMIVLCGLIPLDGWTAYKKIKEDPSNPNNNQSLPFGGKNSRSQINITSMNRLTAMPFGAVIPMKSNLFTYGPYFYDGSNGLAGGVDVIKDTSLCPWNYDKSAFNDTVNIDTVYEHMDCVGKALSKEGVIGLQYLEKGSVTIESLPSYGIGFSVNVTPTGILGPTLVTDIAVDFGSGGVNTSYNFQTYTPRVGRPARYLVDSWAESIKNIQKTNSLLREEKARADNLKIEFNNKIIRNKNNGDTSKALYERTPLNKYSHTPTKILISGYYMLDTIATNSIHPSGSIDPSVNPSSSPDPSCVPCNDSVIITILSSPPLCNDCNCPSNSPSSSPNASYLSNPYPSASGNVNRLYTFAEQHESYSQEYAQNTYKQIAIMSLDGLFLPVSLLGDGIGAVGSLDNNGNPTAISDQFNDVNLYRIPRFASYVSLDGSIKDDIYPLNGPSKTRDSIPPISFGGSYTYNLAINQTFLNPMVSKRMLTDQYINAGGVISPTPKSYGWLPRASGTTNGFVISNIAFGNNFESYKYSIIDDEEFIKQNQENFRFSAHRGPLVVQGWGYDTEGKPIPNYADSPADTERGIFKRHHLTDKFMSDWIQNPRTWPVGPVDLRFDRERGVWTCAPPNKILVAKLTSGLSSFGSANAVLFDNQDYYDNHNLSDKDGRDIKLEISKTKIVVNDYIGKSYPSGTIVYVHYTADTYIVLDGNDKNQISVNPTTGKATILSPEGLPCCENTCWPPDLNILKTLQNYKPETKQALVHTALSGTSTCKQTTTYPPCLVWEDIIDCDPSPSPSVSPSPSPPCSCESRVMINGNYIDIGFPFDVKNITIDGIPDEQIDNYTEPEDPTQCTQEVEVSLDGIEILCTSCDDKRLFVLPLTIHYEKCCENAEPESCTQSITVELSETEASDNCCDNPYYCCLTVDNSPLCNLTISFTSYYC